VEFVDRLIEIKRRVGKYIGSRGVRKKQSAGKNTLAAVGGGLGVRWLTVDVLAWLLIAAASLPLAGCGSEKATVNGRITRKDGTPVVHARINLRSVDSNTPIRTARGVTDDDGRFELGTSEKGDGIYPGRYNVSIVEDRMDRNDVKPRTIAEKYEYADRSGLTLDVARGERNVFDVTLDPK
jgi:hypothetical protein